MTQFEPSWFLAFEFTHFPAQALCARREELRNRPLAVTAQDPENYRSVVRAASFEARDAGVARGMPVRAARRLCRELTVLPRDKQAEAAVLKTAERCLESRTPVLRTEAAGRCVLDLTGTPLLLRLSPPKAAAAVRAELAKATGLAEIAAGLAPSHLLARLLAGEASPRGLRACGPGEAPQVMAQLDPRLLPGLSRGAREKLKNYGLATMAQVRQLGRGELLQAFGEKEGEKLYHLVRGRECAGEKPGSGPIRAEVTLPGDINDGDALRREARLLADRFCYRLKREDLGVERLTFSLQYTDNKIVQKSFRLPGRTSDFLTLADCAERALKVLHTRRAGLKALRLRTARSGSESRQLTLFDASAQKKQRAIGGCVTAIRQKNRFGSIISGSSVNPAKAGLKYDARPERPTDERTRRVAKY